MSTHQHPDVVSETRFGRWFLNTETWANSVVRVAIEDLQRLMPQNFPRPAVMLDVGCGHGHSLRPLIETFRPGRLVGLDCDDDVLANARRRAAELGPSVHLIRGHCATLPLSTGSVDVIFCHQTFHHLRQQETVLAEFHRVLRAGGLLLFAESTRAYIESWIIRLLFRHPMEVQRDSCEYLAMIASHGFDVPRDAVSYPYLWWSRSDLGMMERVLHIRPPPVGERQETLLNVVARKSEQLSV